MEDALRAAAARIGLDSGRSAARREPVGLHAASGTPCPAVAVDGSHAVLHDNGRLWVVAYRAAAVPSAGRLPTVQPEVAVAASDEAAAIVALAWGDGAPERVRTAESFAEALCAAAECRAALAAMQPADPPALPTRGARPLLLVDGALHGLAPPADRLSHRLLEKASATGSRIVGIAKRSRHLPSPVDLPDGVWASPLAAVAGEAYEVRLHPGARHTFRADGRLEDIRELVAWSRDVAYLGYPYPLARAHNAVALTASEVAGLRARLESHLRRLGPRPLAAIADYHHVLDRNVPA